MEAHGARSYSRCDHELAVAKFAEAVKYSASFPRALAMVTWFQYAMSISALNDGGDTLNTLPTQALDRFVRVLEQSKSIYEALPEDTRKELASEDYSFQFGMNLNEAGRIMAKRKEAERLSAVLDGIAAAPRSGPRQNIVGEGESNGGDYTYAYPYGAERLQVGSIGIRCVKCANHVIPLSPCRNCMGGYYLLGTDAWKATTLVCMNCGSGFALVKCACGCDNPIRTDTIMRLKAKG